MKSEHLARELIKVGKEVQQMENNIEQNLIYAMQNAAIKWGESEIEDLIIEAKDS